MSNNNKVSEVLNALHEAVAVELLTRIRAGEAKPADLSVAVKFLKDNGIEAIPTDGSLLQTLFEELPFDEDEEIDLSEPDPFDHTIKVKVSKDIYDNWMQLKKRMLQLNGYDNESKVIEFAIIEALNIPYESLD